MEKQKPLYGFDFEHFLPNFCESHIHSIFVAKRKINGSDKEREKEKEIEHEK